MINTITGLLFFYNTKQYPLKSDPSSVLRPTTLRYFFAMSIPPPATTKSGDRDLSPIKRIIFMAGGYKADRGLISRDITNTLNLMILTKYAMLN